MQVFMGAPNLSEGKEKMLIGHRQVEPERQEPGKLHIYRSGSRLNGKPCKSPLDCEV